MTIKPAQGTIFIIILAIWQFLFGLGAFALAATPTIFVDSNNTSGSESGTTTDPFNTLQEGIDKVATSGVINVAGGSYLDIFLTEDNSNISLVGDVYAEVDTGFFAAGLPSNTLKNVTIDGFQFTGGYSDIFLAYAETLSIANLKVEDGFQGLTLLDVRNSSIKNNIFSQNWVNLVLVGDISGTEIKFNDFISAKQGTQIDASELNTPGTIKLPFNWWGIAEEPSVIDKVDRNKWLVANKDAGKPVGDYHYIGDNGRVKITGGKKSTSTIYLGKYYKSLEDGISSMSGNLAAMGSYYNLAKDEGTIAWPLTLTINYTESELPDGLLETELKGLYYFKNGSWKLYGSDAADDANGCQSSTSVDTETNTISANLCHLTSIVIGGEKESISTSTSTTVTSSSSQTQVGLNIGDTADALLDFLQIPSTASAEGFPSSGKVLGEQSAREERDSKHEHRKVKLSLEEFIIGILLLVGVYLVYNRISSDYE